MKPEDWKRLPPLIRRAQVRAVGIANDAIDQLRLEVTQATDVVPFGRIGAIRGLSRQRHARQRKVTFLYRRDDVGKLLGPAYR